MGLKMLCLIVACAFLFGLAGGKMLRIQDSQAEQDLGGNPRNFVLENDRNQFYWNFDKQMLYAVRRGKPSILYQKGIVYRYQANCWKKTGARDINIEDIDILTLPLRKYKYPYMAEESDAGWNLMMHQDDKWEKIAQYRSNPRWPNIHLEMCSK